MKQKFFDDTIPHFCAYCANGRTNEYTEEIFCLKRGIMDPNDSCRHYKYDPLKRVPNPAKPADNYKPEDFEL